MTLPSAFFLTNSSPFVPQGGCCKRRRASVHILFVMGQQQQQERKRRVRPGAFGAALIGLIGLSSSAICCSAAIIGANNSRSSSTKEGVERIRKLYVRRGDGEAISQSFETEDERRQLSVDSTLHVPFLQQLALTKPPGPLLLSPDRKVSEYLGAGSWVGCIGFDWHVPLMPYGWSD